MNLDEIRDARGRLAALTEDPARARRVLKCEEHQVEGRIRALRRYLAAAERRVNTRTWREQRRKEESERASAERLRRREEVGRAMFVGPYAAPTFTTTDGRPAANFGGSVIVEVRMSHGPQPFRFTLRSFWTYGVRITDEAGLAAMLENLAARDAAPRVRAGLCTAGTNVRWDSLRTWLDGVDTLLARAPRRMREGHPVRVALVRHAAALADEPEHLRAASLEELKDLWALIGHPEPLGRRPFFDGSEGWVQLAYGRLLRAVADRVPQLRGEFA